MTRLFHSNCLQIWGFPWWNDTFVSLFHLPGVRSLLPALLWKRLECVALCLPNRWTQRRDRRLILSWMHSFHKLSWNPRCAILLWPIGSESVCPPFTFRVFKEISTHRVAWPKRSPSRMALNWLSQDSSLQCRSIFWWPSYSSQFFVSQGCLGSFWSEWRQLHLSSKLSQLQWQRHNQQWTRLTSKDSFGVILMHFSAAGFPIKMIWLDFLSNCFCISRGQRENHGESCCPSMPKNAEEAEWVSVARSSAYFGPTLPIFRFLDKDDEAQRWVEPVCFQNLLASYHWQSD